MKEKIPLPIYLVSAILLVYTLLTRISGSSRITWFIFLLSPVLMMWMIGSVLKMRTNAKELEADEEWGYEDKHKEDLGIF